MSRHLNLVDSGDARHAADKDESLSVLIPAPDYTTYEFRRQDTSTNFPDDHAAVNVVKTGASRLARDFNRNSAEVPLPDHTDVGTYERIYEFVDDHAYLEPSPTYCYVSRDLQSRDLRSRDMRRRGASPPDYRRRQSYDVISRRTLLSGTLLLLVDDDDDRHVTGCDVTRPVLALDRHGGAFYVPRSSLRRFDDASGRPWLFPTPLSAHQATVFVAAQRQNGCFVVYRPADEEASPGPRPQYVLAVGLSQGDAQDRISFKVKIISRIFN